MSPTPPAIVLQRDSGIIDVVVSQQDMERLIDELSHNEYANHSEMLIWDFCGHKFTLRVGQALVAEHADVDEVRRKLLLFARGIHGFNPAVLCATHEISEMFTTYVTQTEPATPAPDSNPE